VLEPKLLDLEVGLLMAVGEEVGDENVGLVVVGEEVGPAVAENSVPTHTPAQAVLVQPLVAQSAVVISYMQPLPHRRPASKGLSGSL